MRLPNLDAVRNALARKSLLAWAQLTDHTFQNPAHIAKLIAALEAVERGEIKRLIVTMPPRHGKSLTSSIKFPAWYLGRHPDRRVITASHTAALAYGFSRQVRNDLEEYGPAVFRARVASDSSAVDHWAIANDKGGMIAAGIGGPLTGQGADLLVIDDPVKNAEDARSEVQRAAQKEWYQQVARTRLHPGGAIVVCQTRWHMDDLAGWLLAESAINGEHWEVLNLPMVDEEGAILWPDRYSQTEVDGIRKAVGESAWEALFQGRPTPPEGAMFKKTWWKFYEEPPAKFDVMCASWDMAVKDTGDYVVGQVWGRVKANFYLLDQVRGRWDFPRTCEMVKTLHARWPTVTPILIEDKANGPAVIQTLRSLVPGIVAVEPKGGKEARAAAVSPLVEAGNVYLPSRVHCGYVDELMTELSAFPNGAHDDAVDTMTQALNRLRQQEDWFSAPVNSPKAPREWM